MKLEDGPLLKTYLTFSQKPSVLSAHFWADRQEFASVFRSSAEEFDPNLKDTSGIAAPRVVYSYNENILKMLEHGGKMARQALESGRGRDPGQRPRHSRLSLDGNGAYGHKSAEVSRECIKQGARCGKIFTSSMAIRSQLQPR